MGVRSLESNRPRAANYKVRRMGSSLSLTGLSFLICPQRPSCFLETLPICLVFDPLMVNYFHAWGP